MPILIFGIIVFIAYFVIKYAIINAFKKINNNKYKEMD